MLTNNVEIDEMHIGDKEVNNHEYKKLKAGRGMHEWDGRVKAMSINTPGKETLPQLTGKIEPGATISTDEHRGCIGFAKEHYTHHSVRHCNCNLLKFT